MKQLNTQPVPTKTTGQWPLKNQRPTVDGASSPTPMITGVWFVWSAESNNNNTVLA